MDISSMGSVLCQLRKKNAMTQKELAARLSVHLTTIKNWESSSCFPDAKNICALADLFHVTTDYLLGRQYGETIVSVKPLHEQTRPAGRNNPAGPIKLRGNPAGIRSRPRE